jgi:hypothetical protein
MHDVFGDHDGYRLKNAVSQSACSLQLFNHRYHSPQM